jgi:hypothetical protein
MLQHGKAATCLKIVTNDDDSLTWGGTHLPARVCLLERAWWAWDLNDDLDWMLVHYLAVGVVGIVSGVRWRASVGPVTPGGGTVVRIVAVEFLLYD